MKLDEEKEKVVAGKCVEIPEGKFQVFEKDGKIWVYSYKSVETYQIKVDEPFCSCPDFNYNKRGRKICKHLRAARKAGYDVADLQPVREVSSTEIVEAKETREISETPSISIRPLTPDRLLDITSGRVSIDSIIKSSKDGSGDGVLYDNTKIGPVVKEDLVAMIARSMGIVSETIGYPKYEQIKTPNGDTIVLVRSQAKAYHIKYPDNPVIRSATVLMDFSRIEKESRDDKEGRTFADRICESNACRRAELAMMGIPEKSLVHLVKSMISLHKGKKPRGKPQGKPDDKSKKTELLMTEEQKKKLADFGVHPDVKCTFKEAKDMIETMEEQVKKDEEEGDFFG